MLLLHFSFPHKCCHGWLVRRTALFEWVQLQWNATMLTMLHRFIKCDDCTDFLSFHDHLLTVSVSKFVMCYYQLVITFLHLGRKQSLKLATVQVFDDAFAATIIYCLFTAKSNTDGCMKFDLLAFRMQLDEYI